MPHYSYAACATCGIRVQFSACHINVSSSLSLPYPLPDAAPVQMLHYCQIINSTTRAYGRQIVSFPLRRPRRYSGPKEMDFLIIFFGFSTLSLIIYWRTATATSITFSLNAFQ